MKKAVITIVFALMTLLAISADDIATVAKELSSSFNVVFTKVGIPDIRFTPYQTYDQKQTDFDFPDYFSPGQVISVSLSIYWRAYDTPITLMLQFIDSSSNPESGYMLHGVSEGNKNVGYNYNVSVENAVNNITETNTQGNAFSVLGISADDPTQELTLNDNNTSSEKDRTIYIMRNIQNDNDVSYVQGQADLTLTLSEPKGGFTTGQYEGVIKMILSSE